MASNQSPNVKIELTDGAEQKCGLCLSFDSSEVTTSCFCVTCGEHLCTDCELNHRKIPALHQHGIRQTRMSPDTPPNLINQMIDFRAYDPNQFDSKFLSVVSTRWFRSYAKYLIDDQLNEAPGPVEHCPPDTTELKDFYVLSKETAEQLHQFFGTNQRLPLMEKSDYEEGIWVGILDIKDIKYLTDPKLKHGETKIFMWKQKLGNFKRMLSSEAVELPIDKSYRDLCKEFGLKSYDSVHVSF